MDLALIALVVTMFIIAAMLMQTPMNRLTQTVLAVILIVFAVVLCLGHAGVVPATV